MHAGLPQSHKRQRGRDSAARDLAPARLRAAGEDEELAARMRQEQTAYQDSAAARDMMAFRRKLPSFQAREEFLAAVDRHQARLCAFMHAFSAGIRRETRRAAPATGPHTSPRLPLTILQT